jgi:hypothetical protein
MPTQHPCELDPIEPRALELDVHEDGRELLAVLSDQLARLDIAARPQQIEPAPEVELRDIPIINVVLDVEDQALVPGLRLRAAHTTQRSQSHAIYYAKLGFAA